MFKTLDSFYRSDKWIKFRLAYIGEHNPICGDCQKFIIESKELHLHHIEELTLENVNDANVSLNPDNIVILCHDCHNKRHQRFGYGYGNRKTKWDKGVYLVYGPPFAGKKTFVKEQMQPGDLVIELDLLYQALSLQERYVNPSDIKANVFAVKNLLLDQVKMRYGKYSRAWVIGGYPDRAARERLANDLGAEIILIETDKTECLNRLNHCQDERAHQKREFKRYIQQWFEEWC
ncbi:HNH endonuclease [Turicibacter sanguinis]|nr:HNH endonuclease [Turicibacter sanguinis]